MNLPPILFIACTFFGSHLCFPQNDLSIGTDLALSPDNQNIAYVKHNPGNSVIKEFNFSTRESILIANLEHKKCLRQRYSNDGKFMVFVATSLDLENSEVYLYSFQNQVLSKLFDVEGFVQSLDISSTNKELYFTKAGEFKNYSPFAKAAFHGYNLFKYDFQSAQISVVITLNSYSMGAIFLSNDDKLIYTNIAGSKNEKYRDINGMCIINLVDNKIDSIVVVNNPRQDVKEYCYPSTTSDPNFILFEAPYELYGYDLKNKLVEDLITAEMKGMIDKMFIYSPILNDEMEVIYFVAGYPNGEEKLYSLTVKKREINEIEIQSKKKQKKGKR